MIAKLQEFDPETEMCTYDALTGPTTTPSFIPMTDRLIFNPDTAEFETKDVVMIY